MFRRFVVASLLLLTVVGCASPSDPGPAGSIPEEVIQHNILGTAYLGQFSWDDADKAFSDALALRDNDPILLNNMGVTRVQQNRLDEAREQFQAALQADAQFPWAHYNLGLLAKNEGDFETAVTHFEAVAAHDGDDLETQYNLGSALARVDRPDDAEAAFTTALEKNPIHVSTLYAFGQFLMQNGRQTEGIELIQRSEEIRTRYGGDTIGTQYGEQGVYAMGIDYPGDRLAAPEAITVQFSADEASQRAATAMAISRSAAWAATADGIVSIADGTVVAPSPGDVLALASADSNDDAESEPFALVRSGDELALHVFASGSWQSLATLPNGGDDADLVAVDKDHDGDLDLFWCTDRGCGITINDGSGNFSTVDGAGIGIDPGSLSAPIHLSFSDVDNDRDIDLVVGDANGIEVYSNLRDGNFEAIGDAIGLGGAAAGSAFAIVDLDKDARMDVVTASARGLNWFANRGGRFEAPTSLSAAAADSVVVVDADNDGFLDLLSASEGTVTAMHNRGVGQWETRSDWWSGAGSPQAAVDADGDGDLDVIASTESGVALWRNDGGDAANSIVIDAEGVGDNRFGVGAKVEVLAGALRQKFELTDPAPLVVGLGSRSSVQSVRILWPSGVLQDEVNRDAAQIASIKQLDRKGTSCPLLYAWRDGQWNFVTDFLGGAAIGYQQAPGRFNTPDTDEYVLLEGGLSEVDGTLRVRLNNQLEEVIWFDRTELLVVDHPVGTSIFPNEKLMPGPPWPEFALYASDDLRDIPSAVGVESGVDHTATLQARDRKTVDDFELLPFKGYAEAHTLELSLQDVPLNGRLILVLEGWIDYADSSANVGAHQTTARLQPPQLIAADGRGGWKSERHSIGFPAGLPKPMTVDLTGLVDARDPRVRIATNMRIYWDRARILVGGEQTPVNVQRVDAVNATLRAGGFPEPYTPDGKKPPMYNPASVQKDGGWKAHIGNYTGFGDVRPLLQAIDDAFVTTRNGDELELHFPAPAPPAEGFTRSYLLFADGFGKDMDPNSAANNTVSPLPFHGMPYYPYGDEVDVPLRPRFEGLAEERRVRPDPRGLPGALPQTARREDDDR